MALVIRVFQLSVCHSDHHARASVKGDKHGFAGCGKNDRFLSPRYGACNREMRKGGVAVVKATINMETTLTVFDWARLSHAMTD
jgi:hypothetical protein